MRFDQTLAGADREAGNVVDGFVGIQLDRLAAHVGQGIDDVSPDVQQAQFEHLEQAHRACSDDHGIDGDPITGGQRRPSARDALPWLP